MPVLFDDTLTRLPTADSRSALHVGAGVQSKRCLLETGNERREGVSMIALRYAHTSVDAVEAGLGM
jgi:hypothetical protein